jgi:hypothetical protein
MSNNHDLEPGEIICTEQTKHAAPAVSTTKKVGRRGCYLEANVAVAMGPLEVLGPLLHDLRRQQRHRHL